MLGLAFAAAEAGGDRRTRRYDAGPRCRRSDDHARRCTFGLGLVGLVATLGYGGSVARGDGRAGRWSSTPLGHRGDPRPRGHRDHVLVLSPWLPQNRLGVGVHGGRAAHDDPVDGRRAHVPCPPGTAVSLCTSAAIGAASWVAGGGCCADGRRRPPRVRRAARRGRARAGRDCAPRLHPVTDAHGARMGALGALRAGAGRRAVAVDAAGRGRLRAVRDLDAMQYPFAGAMTAAFPGQGELATALGPVRRCGDRASFLMALSSRPPDARLGVGGTVALLLSWRTSGFGVVRDLRELDGDRVKFTQEATQRGLSNTAWNVFFSVVPASGAARSGRSSTASRVRPHGNRLGALLDHRVRVLQPAAVRGRRRRIPGMPGRGLDDPGRYAASLVATLRGGLAEQVLEGGRVAARPAVSESATTCAPRSRPSVRRAAPRSSPWVGSATRDVASDLLRRRRPRPDRPALDPRCARSRRARLRRPP